ncbi:MAG: VWA domain-containing protein [Defluviitaleaceae bacterium]|nr:VWA domain-containing protein [Defluviitaleaceae bacterium]
MRIKTVFVFLLLLYFAAAHVRAERTPISAVLVLDVSNSMRYTDPNNLAREAMGLFIDMLGTDNGDRIGVVAYAGEVIDYLPMTAINDTDDVNAIKAFITALGYAGWTDHSLGLDKALRILTEDGDFSVHTPIILLLTDGNTEIPPASIRTHADADNDIDRILSYAADITIYTIGLNDNGTLNRAFIDNIAQATGGQSFETTSAEALSDIIGKILTPYITPPIPMPLPQPFPIPNTEYKIYDLLFSTPDFSFVNPVSSFANSDSLSLISNSESLILNSESLIPDSEFQSLPSRLLPLFLITGSILSKAVVFLFFLRRRSRVFTGRLILESPDRNPRHHNLIAYGKRTTLRALHGGDARLDKIVLTPSPNTPSHRPQLLLTCKTPQITFRKDFMETDAKKGLIISPGAEVMIRLPENDMNITLKYVA